jgi:hypothetical protein
LQQFTRGMVQKKHPTIEMGGAERIAAVIH